MLRIFRLGFFFLLTSACAASALPPLVFYSYTPPAPPPLEMLSTVPTDHQEFTTPPDSVKITFSQNIDPSRSDVTVADPYNNPVPATKIIKDTGMGLALTTSGMHSGAYRVDWRATCMCKAATYISGTFYFTID